MQFISTFLFILITSFAFGQANFNYPKIKYQGRNYKDFIPVGWTAIDTAEGDINKDMIKDAALVLQCKESITTINEGDTLTTHPRILIVLLQNTQNQTFKLATQSTTFIINSDNPALEDPYQEIEITKGILMVKFQPFYNMGSWYTTNTSYKFHYQNNQFALIGADYYSFHRATHDYEEYSFNFLSKKRSLTKGNEKEKIKKTTWSTITFSELKTLETLKKPFDWEIEEGILL